MKTAGGLVLLQSSIIVTTTHNCNYAVAIW